MNYKIGLLIFFSLIFAGCSAYSLKEFAEQGVESAYYEDLINIREYNSMNPCVQKFRDENIFNEYNLSNGNFVYAEPFVCKCIVHWEIDRQTEKVVGYRFEGANCPKD